MVVFARLIFFFKQKTAYEMRISDWSSDVCSSDLVLWTLDAPDGVAATAAIAGGRVFVADLSGDLRCVDRGTGEVVWTYKSVEKNDEKIGRASCGERVCQYA